MSYETYEVRVYPRGTKCWYRDGKLHRDDGPAIENCDGSKHWYRDGKRHRDDGPAVEYANGSRHWCLESEWVSEEEWKRRVSQSNDCDGRTVEIDGVKYRLQKLD